MEKFEMSVPSGFVSVKEWSRRSTLSVSTIYQMMADGQLVRPLQIARGRVAWTEEQWADWCASLPLATAEDIMASAADNAEPNDNQIHQPKDS